MGNYYTTVKRDYIGRYIIQTAKVYHSDCIEIIKTVYKNHLLIGSIHIETWPDRKWAIYYPAKGGRIYKDF